MIIPLPPIQPISIRPAPAPRPMPLPIPLPLPIAVPAGTPAHHRVFAVVGMDDPEDSNIPGTSSLAGPGYLKALIDKYVTPFLAVGLDGVLFHPWPTRLLSQFNAAEQVPYRLDALRLCLGDPAKRWLVGREFRDVLASLPATLEPILYGGNASRFSYEKDFLLALGYALGIGASRGGDSWFMDAKSPDPDAAEQAIGLGLLARRLLRAQGRDFYGDEWALTSDDARVQNVPAICEGGFFAKNRHDPTLCKTAEIICYWGSILAEQPGVALLEELAGGEPNVSFALDLTMQAPEVLRFLRQL